MRIGLHALDAALALAREGAYLAARPSILHCNPQTPELFGADASADFRRLPHVSSTRHWQALTTDAGASTAAALIGAELRTRTATLREQCAAGEPLILEVAVPSGMPRAALARLFVAARAQSLQIGGFFDASALAVAASGLAGVTLVIEFGLHQLTVSRVVMSEGEARLLECDTRQDYGLLALYEAWMQLVSEIMVLQHRFDPLHEGASEQRLYDHLSSALSELSAQGSFTLRWPLPSGPVSITLLAEQFAQRASPVLRELNAALRALRSAGEPVNILLNRHDFELPGVAATLEAMHGATIRVMSPELIVKAASLQHSEVSSGPVALRRAIAATHAIESAVVHEPAVSRSVLRRVPSHVFHEGKALPLSRTAAFEIGSASDNSGLVLPSGLAGVSRRHCSLRYLDEELVVIDHSRHGTWLNEERIAGRAVARPGDRLRIGEPGVQIELIAVGAGDGAPPG